jgi:hypothetical protein
VHRDEPTLHDLKATAIQTGRPLELVMGSAPGWSDPWSWVCLALVVESGWHTCLVDLDGFLIVEKEVQLARLAPSES